MTHFLFDYALGRSEAGAKLRTLSKSLETHGAVVGKEGEEDEVEEAVEALRRRRTRRRGGGVALHGVVL